MGESVVLKLSEFARFALSTTNDNQAPISIGLPLNSPPWPVFSDGHLFIDLDCMSLS